MIFSSYISMATKPIAFNEGAIEFLTGYLIGIGELQVNPDPVNWTEPSIMLFCVTPVSLIRCIFLVYPYKY